MEKEATTSSDESTSLQVDNHDSYGASVEKGGPVGSQEKEQQLTDLATGAEAEENGGNQVSPPQAPEKPKRKREQWDNRVQFVISLIGFAVGIGNIWRFPYYCAKNGGGAFLIPYILMLFIVGIPLFYMEILLGQSVKRGPFRVWFKISPNLAGIGIAMSIITLYISAYYNVIMSWVMLYFFNSFQSPLPWGKCFGCTVEKDNLTALQVCLDGLVRDNTTSAALNLNDTVQALESCWNFSTRYFWYHTALESSDSIEVAGTFNWRVLLCLFGAWVVIYFCLFKGIKWAGKIVYFTALLPYVVLICLFFRAVTLSGAGDGLRFFFIPSADVAREKLTDPQVWLEAATQIFFSLGLALGALIALSSYSKPTSNALRDSFIVCIANALTSVFASIIIFSVVGFQHHITKTPLTQEGLIPGPGLAFIILTEALLYMPGAPFWAVIMFIMLLMLGVDSQFATLEGFVTMLIDSKRVSRVPKEVLVGILCVSMFLGSIPFMLGNGVYLFQMFDQYAGTLPLLVLGFMEFIAVAWVFGVKRFFTEVASPVHIVLRVVWTSLWKWIGPIVLLIIFIGSVAAELIVPLTYTASINYEEVEVEYPDWAKFIGAVIILSSILAIPIFLIIRLVSAQEAREEAVGFITAFVRSVTNVGYYVRDVGHYCRRRYQLWDKHATDYNQAGNGEGISYNKLNDKSEKIG